MGTEMGTPPKKRQVARELDERNETLWQYEEYTPVSRAWTWILLAGYGLSLMIAGMVSHMIIPEVPRTWDYGARPDTPSSSIYATTEPVRKLPGPQQIQVLPEAEERKSTGATEEQAEPGATGLPEFEGGPQ